MKRILLRRITVIILPVLAVVGIIFLVRYCTRDDQIQEEPMVVVPPQMKYGIVIDSFNLHNRTVLKDQNFSDILTYYGVDYQIIDMLVKLSYPVFDLRKLRAGNSYTVMCSDDTAQKAHYLVYEDSPVSFVVYGLTDSLCVYRTVKDMKRVVTTTHGSISSSLWNAMIESGADPALAMELSDIYAWTVDFFGIQKGDTYDVLYEQLIVEGDTIGIGKVLAACLNNEGHAFYAFRYVQDSVAGYYDEQAKNLRRAFLKAPLQYRRISSRFTHSRYHPILKIRRPHHGVDYSAPAGTPVQTIGDGTVVQLSYQKGGGGRMIKIKHNGTYTTVYMHLKGYAKGIRQGARVRQGDVIGYVGSTGLSTGPHLDFRVYKNGTPIDPLKMESPPADPVKPAYRPEFDSIRMEYTKQLTQKNQGITTVTP
ncbi:MAG TPA: peptidoglycan DD-metalloendopeptidase family protein [Bacteroidales bacterium]|nr:peptidoglycan DD-metalloendopeptidase family protein [Bacteroidales bacterium]HRZ20875.1 peptidoglycan DD-metalloendopeptidase family protein [Bacteroidales bacterium]